MWWRRSRRTTIISLISFKKDGRPRVGRSTGRSPGFDRPGRGLPPQKAAIIAETAASGQSATYAALS
jgi:hypothetical protein